MAKKNQTTEQVSTDAPIDDKPSLTLAEARTILAAEKGVYEPLQRGAAQRVVNAATRAAMSPEARAKADFMDLINDVADRINLGGKTISGACGRFSSISRETGKSLVSVQDLNRGLDYLLKQVELARAEIGVKVADRTGFEL